MARTVIMLINYNQFISTQNIDEQTYVEYQRQSNAGMLSPPLMQQQQQQQQHQQQQTAV